MKPLFFTLFFFISFFSFSQSGNLSIHISQIRNNKGTIRIGIYQNEKQYKTDQAFIKKIVKKTGVINSTMIVEMSLDEGVYGIALMDDENDNGKMDYGLILPTEGFGFSNIYHEGFSKPDYHKLTFKIEPQKSHKVYVKMRYM